MLIRVNNILLDPEKVVYVEQDEKDIGRVTVVFDNGRSVTFRGPEGGEVWRVFDESDWRKESD